MVITHKQTNTRFASVSLSKAVTIVSTILVADNKTLENWVAIAYSIINGRFTRSELLKASGADIKSPLSKAVRFAWFIDGDSAKAKSLRLKYENDKLASLEQAYSFVPKITTKRTKQLSESEALKIVFSSIAFKALPRATQIAIRKASK
jgi:hypothetical protein